MPLSLQPVMRTVGEAMFAEAGSSRVPGVGREETNVAEENERFSRMMKKMDVSVVEVDGWAGLGPAYIRCVSVRLFEKDDVVGVTCIDVGYVGLA
jgi:hypothetical protein